jgi:hypothetical protein
MSEQDPNRSRVEPSWAGGPAPQSPSSTASAGAPRSGAPGWERSVLEKLVMATVVEQRRARRWRIFFRFVALGVALLFIAAGLGWLPGADGTAAAGRHTAVVEIDGVAVPADRLHGLADGLRIDAPPAAFELLTVVAIAPASNTELMGLYLSNGSF